MKPEKKIIHFNRKVIKVEDRSQEEITRIRKQNRKEMLDKIQKKEES